MATYGAVSLISPSLPQVSNYNTPQAPVTSGPVNMFTLPEIDYAYLAGMVGQGVVAATGGTPVTVTTKGASGSFDTQKVTAIIGQQIAAAVSAH